MKLDGSTAHLIAGGVGGTIGAICTCPLEVVKVRLQSSVATFKSPVYSPVLFAPTNSHQNAASTPISRPKLSIWGCMKCIAKSEGVGALFKGIGPTLIGVLPSRAVYFGAYHKGQELFKNIFPATSSANYMASSAFGGIVAASVTNPIWYIKTRLQLDQQSADSRLTVKRCVSDTFRERGLLGFYRGIQASYLGVTETAIHFVIYERLKKQLLCYSRARNGQDAENLSGRITGVSEVAYCMLASTLSKSIATTLCYPHEVVRTLLRQEGNKYHGLVQTFKLVCREDGWKGLYRGLATHYVRQIPNTGILMASYEAAVYVMEKYDLIQ